MVNRNSFSLGLIVFLALSGCASQQAQENDASIDVVATFYPLAEFARQVGGEDINVLSITPPGVEPHDYEPSPQDVKTVLESDLLLINGSGLDPWAERIADNAQSVRSIVMTEAMDLLEASEEHEHEDEIEEDHEEESEEHANEVFDPHVWLDPIHASTMVKHIRDVLIDIDPSHADDYTRRAAAYMETLATLHQEFVTGLSSCPMEDIFVSHAAFGYLTHRYGLHMHAIAGISPDEEPSPRAIAELADRAREENIDYVFFETLVSPKLAQTLAGEIGAQTLVLNPIEGLTPGEMAQGMDYVSVMRENLNNLRIALHCQQSQ